jgi:hypothetical protein
MGQQRMGLLRRPTLLLLFLGLLALAHAVSAQEYYNPNGIVFVPAPPTAGQAFIVRWDALDCIDIRALRSATVTESRLLMVVEYIQPAPGLPGCTDALRRNEWTIGPFPAGDYTFELMGIHPFFNEVTGDIAEFPLTIVPYATAPPNVVPAGTVAGCLLLSLLLGLGAMVANRAPV